MDIIQGIDDFVILLRRERSSSISVVRLASVPGRTKRWRSLTGGFYKSVIVVRWEKGDWKLPEELLQASSHCWNLILANFKVECSARSFCVRNVEISYITTAT
jgi:hypothetical protein